MNTLLMRLVAPMQSWGIQSHYSVRDTGTEPSKSGVIGLICAALGRERTADVEDLARLRMGVRVDREGTIQCDYHIAQDVLSSDTKSRKPSITSRRYYLADAAFLVGLEGEDLSLLEQIHHALAKPVWALYLGRKAFVPSAPVYLPDGLRRGERLEQALANYGWICSPAGGDESLPKRIRLIIESPDGEQIRPDVPVSFARRRFSSRRISQRMIDAPQFTSKVIL